MIKAGDSGETTTRRPSRSARMLWAASACAAVVLLVAAWAFPPSLKTTLGAMFPRAARREVAVGTIHVMMAMYALFMVGLVLSPPVLLGLAIRKRGVLSLRPKLGRLLLLDVSLLIGLTGLEVAAAAWMGWLHRHPALPAGLAASGDGSFRILVIGESSAEGQPYQPWLSVGQIVAWQLERVFPHRRVQVDMRAEGGATLERVHQKLAEINYRPDAVILFCGHNEFQARWPWFRGPRYYADEYNMIVRMFDAVFDLLPSCRLIRETLDRRQVGAIPLKRVTRPLIDRPTFTRAERSELLDDFQRRLGAIAAYCESLGTVAVFIVPGSNDGDYEPSRSALPPNTEQQARAAFAREFEEVRGTERSEPDRAVAGYRSLIERAPGFAEAHYRLARLLEAAGSWAEARDHYIRARECDVMPMRCSEDFRQAYRDVAGEHPAVVLVESAEVLGRLSPHGILDDHLYHDAQHPTFRGYLALAEAVLQRLQTRGALGWPSGAAAPRIDPDACADHFQLDREKWVKVCERSAWFYEVTAYARHEPSRRLRRAETYAAAAGEIGRGGPPELAGVTGLGVHPTPPP